MTVTRIQLRRNNSTVWSSVNPIIESGEPCYELDTGVLKIGDGVTTYNTLPTVGGIGSIVEWSPSTKYMVTDAVLYNDFLFRVKETHVSTSVFDFSKMDSVIPGVIIVNQTAHGLAILNVIRHNGSVWVKALANNDSTLSDPPTIVVMVSSNYFVAVSTPCQLVAPSHGLNIGSFYYLSAVTAGATTSTPPTRSNPIFKVIDSNTISIVSYRPLTISATSITEAPINGEIYGRQNGEWEIIPTSLEIDSVTSPIAHNPTTKVLSHIDSTTIRHVSDAEKATWNGKQSNIPTGTTAQYYRGDKKFVDLISTIVNEGTNLYFTNARARTSVSGSSPISYNSSTGVISHVDSATVRHVTDTEKTTWNGKANDADVVKLVGTQTITGPKIFNTLTAKSATSDGLFSVESSSGNIWSLITSNGSGSFFITNNTAGEADFVITATGTITAPNATYVGSTSILNAGVMDLRYANISHTQAWSTITSKPTTISGYGITNGVTTDTTQTITGPKIFSGTTTLGTIKFESNNEINCVGTIYIQFDGQATQFGGAISAANATYTTSSSILNAGAMDARYALKNADKVNLQAELIAKPQFPSYNQAAQYGFWNTREVKTTTGSFTVPAGVTMIGIICIGKGANGTKTAGGGGGGLAAKVRACTPGEVISYTIGTSAVCESMTATGGSGTTAGTGSGGQWNRAGGTATTSGGGGGVGGNGGYGGGGFRWAVVSWDTGGSSGSDSGSISGTSGGGIGGNGAITGGGGGFCGDAFGTYGGQVSNLAWLANQPLGLIVTSDWDKSSIVNPGVTNGADNGAWGCGGGKNGYGGFGGGGGYGDGGGFGGGGGNNGYGGFGGGGGNSGGPTGAAGGIGGGGARGTTTPGTGGSAAVVFVY